MPVNPHLDLGSRETINGKQGFPLCICPHLNVIVLLFDSLRGSTRKHHKVLVTYRLAILPIEHLNNDSTALRTRQSCHCHYGDRAKSAEYT